MFKKIKLIHQNTIFIFLIFTALSCKKENKDINSPDLKPNKETQTKSIHIGNCYKANLEGNIIELQVQYNDNNVSGTLTYDFEGKEVSQGTFKGKMKQNILIADYVYLSENKTRERQIAFKMINHQFVEGYGERLENSTKFKDISKLKFNSNMPLKKVDCP